MTFTPPITEQRFVLDHIVGLADLASTERFAAAEPDMVDAILEGAAALAAGEWAPLNRIGDQQGAVWTDGTVTLPPGFAEAYRAFRGRDPDVNALLRTRGFPTGETTTGGTTGNE